jgi:type II secretory pathway component PulJ
MKKRLPAFTLIEMVVYISCFSVVMGLTVGVVGALIKVERANRNASTESSTLARVMLQFRRDVHAATAFSPPAVSGKTRTTIELKLPHGQKVTYRLQDAALVVIRDRPNEGHREERVPLTAFANARFGDAEQEGRTILSIEVDRKPVATKAANALSLRVEAVVGRDHRFVGQGVGS